MLDLGTLQLGIKVNGDAAKAELNQVGNEVEKTGTKTDTLASKAKTMIKAFVAAYAIKELVKLGKAALDAYAQFEQLEGGVNKIFGKEAAQEVMKNANEAYKTAGMSANQYMETVTNFSASLISSMEGDTKAAAKVADMAVQDMSDNANTFGTNIKSIQDAYQGFAKQNYSMLDNLKLGYGGSRAEMERLLQDAEKLTGKKYDISNLNDVYEAIHVIQEEYNITGTTAKEASHTIEGSMNTMKASFENFLTSLGSGKGVGKATTQLLDSIGNVAKNVAPVAMNIVKSLIEAMAKAVPKFLGKLGDFMSKIADGIGQGGKGDLGKTAVKIIETLVKGLIKNLPKLITGAFKLVSALSAYLIQALPEIVKVGVKAIGEFVKGFLQGHPKIAAAVEKIKGIFDTAIAPIKAIIDGVRKAWEKLMGSKDKKKFNVETPFSGAIDKMTKIKAKWEIITKAVGKKTFEIISKGFSSAIDKMKSIWNKWKDILNQSSTKTFTTKYEQKGKPAGKGGHRIGLREVPYDGYEAVLHKGEAVMTAAEVNKLKKQSNTITDSGNLTVNVYGSNNMSVEELAAAVERRIINVQKRRTQAWA